MLWSPIAAKGFDVRPLARGEIEKLRQWRNSDHVRINMISQELISSQQQSRWFGEISRSDQKHFIYSYRKVDVGHINMSPIDETAFEGGILCGASNFLGHPVNIYALIWLYDFAFFEHKYSSGRARVLASNDRALRVNILLGFKTLGTAKKEVLELRLSRQDYEEKRKEVLKLIGSQLV